MGKGLDIRFSQMDNTYLFSRERQKLGYPLYRDFFFPNPVIPGITSLIAGGEEPHHNTTPEIAPRGDGEGGEGPLLCFHGISL